MKTKGRASRHGPRFVGEVPEQAMGLTLNQRLAVYLPGDAGVVGSTPTLSAKFSFEGACMFR